MTVCSIGFLFLS